MTDLSSVFAIVGQSKHLELSCKVNTETCGEVYYITWTKLSNSPVVGNALPTAVGNSDNLLTTSTTTTNANSQQQQQQQHWQRVYLFAGSNDSQALGDLTQRANFVMPTKRGDTTAKLIISDVKQTDDALYKCDVTYVQGKCPSITTTSVKILSKPKKAVVVTIQQNNDDNNNNKLNSNNNDHQPEYANFFSLQNISSMNQNYNEGQVLGLSCFVFGGVPTPTVFWRKISSLGVTSKLNSNKIYTSNPRHQNENQFSSLVDKQFSFDAKKKRFIGHNDDEFIRVDLEKLLDSSDLNAKFECHVEHQTIQLLTEDNQQDNNLESLDTAVSIDLNGKLFIS